VRCSLLLLTLASPHTSWSHRTWFEAENPPLLSWALLLASRPSMDPAVAMAKPTLWPLWTLLLLRALSQRRT
jgi:hypothetical protein